MRKYALLMGLCLVAAVLIMAWGLREPLPDDQGIKGKVALVLAQDSGTYIMKLKSGAQDAATDRNVELSVFVAPHGLPSQVLSGEFSAVVLTADTGMDLAQARAALGETPLIMIGGPGGSYSVEQDAIQEGTSAAAALRALAPGKILLLEDGSAPDRLAGARTALANTDHQVLAWTPDMTWQQIADLRPDALLILSQALTFQAAEAKAQGILDGGLPLSGFAQGDEAPGLLESGALDAVTVPQPYAMGYRAVEAVFTKQNAQIPGKTLALDSLYHGENVALAFPLLQ